MKKKNVIAGLIVVFLVLSGNIIYYYSMQIKQPVFLKHYYDLVVTSDVSFDLHYLVNRSTDEGLVNIGIPGIGTVYANDRTRTEDTYTHYHRKKAGFSLDKKQIEEALSKGELEIKEVTAYFNNGKSQKVDLGEIYLFKYPQGKRNLKETAVGSSNQNNGFRVIKADEPVKLTGFQSKFKDMLADSFRVYIDTFQGEMSDIELESMENNRMKPKDSLYSDYGREVSEKGVFPIKLDKGGAVKINYEFIFKNEEDSLSYNYYKTNGRLKIEGQSDHIFEMHYTPYFTGADIRKIIRDRRGE